MRLRRLRVLPVLAFGLVTALAGCGSSTPSANPPASSSTSSMPSTSPSAVPTTPFQRVTPTPMSGAMDEKVTAQVRADLVAAGAAARHLKASDFIGLEPGLTYYAYDATTRTYWAGGALKPSPSSYNAQVSSQDDGSYTVFHRAAGAAWIATDSGMAGPNSGAAAGTCSVVPPADVLAVWGWPAHSCHPTGS